MYSESFKQVSNNESAIIKVENIKAPILLLSGEDDCIWPASMMADSIISRLKKHHHPFEFRHIRYANTGHGLFDSPVYQGGTKEGNDFADKDGYPQIIAFLDKYLKAP